MRKHPYQKLLDRKRKWSPVQTTAGELKHGAEETIYRALAIRHMELPVGEFIEDALGEVPDLSRDLLRSNVKDEENHDLALGYIANAIGVDPKAGSCLSSSFTFDLSKSLESAGTSVSASSINSPTGSSKWRKARAR